MSGHEKARKYAVFTVFYGRFQPMIGLEPVTQNAHKYGIFSHFCEVIF